MNAQQQRMAAIGTDKELSDLLDFSAVRTAGACVGLGGRAGCNAGGVGGFKAAKSRRPPLASAGRERWLGGPVAPVLGILSLWVGFVLHQTRRKQESCSNGNLGSENYCCFMILSF